MIAQSDIGEFLLTLVKSSEFTVPVTTVLISIIIINVLSKIVRKIITRKSGKAIYDKRRNTIVVLLNNIIKYAIILLDVVIIFDAWGVNVAGFITGLGVAGVVAGLALQDALKDIIMGCNIILDNYFVVGDYVTINDFTGEVIEFGLKNTKIKNLNDETLVIANREITNVINYSLKNFILKYTIDVAYEEDEDKVGKLLEEIIDELYNEKIIKRKGVYLGIDSFDASSIKYVMCVECNPKEQFFVRRTINGKIKKSFDKHNVKIPYTQIEVHNGKGI